MPQALLTLALGRPDRRRPGQRHHHAGADRGADDAIGAGDRVWGLYRTDGGRRLALATGKMRVLQGV
jgi:hypothetical protein